MLQVKRKRATIEIILDQVRAQEIVELGEQLNQTLAKGWKTEGGDQTARQLAARIEELHEAVAADAVSLEIEALTYSQWSAVLTEHTRVEKGVAKRDIVGTIQASLRAMTRSLKPEDVTVEEVIGVIPELTDGQLTPIWKTILDLNGALVDPKAAVESASRIARKR